MRKPVRSLYSRIILVIAMIFGTGSIVMGAAAWFYARVAADDAYDRLLVGAALQIAESIYAQEGTVSVDPPVSAFETLSLSTNDRIFYKVVDPRGDVLTGYDDLAPARSFADKHEPLISDGEYRGFPVQDGHRRSARLGSSGARMGPGCRCPDPGGAGRLDPGSDVEGPPPGVSP